MTTIGRYEIVQEIGRGPTGIVYRALDTHLQRQVAIKLFLASVDFDVDEIFQSLRRIAFIQARAEHQNIARIFDVGRENEQVFVVSELIEGKPVEPTPFQRLMPILQQVAEALDYAQVRGLIHGNLKPTNILVGKHDRVAITDFRLAGLREQPRGPISAALLDRKSDQSDLASIVIRLLDQSPLLETILPILQRAQYPGSARFSTCVEFVAALEFQAEHPQGMAPASEPPNPVDEDVQFTIYRPQAIPPDTWKMLLAFAHRSARRPDAPPDEPDPLQQVQDQARDILGAQVKDYRDIAQDSRHAIPREGQLTFLPEMAGIDFQPASLSLQWQGRVHPAVFLMRAQPAFLGKTLRGQLSIFLGSIVVAQVPLAVRVENTAAAVEAPAYVREEAPWYRRIFASYSHRDIAIVEEFERHAIAFGDDYLRDLTKLRSGSRWDESLLKMIRDADVFQLFWSNNAMHSEYVQREYKYALSLHRERFIRPVYWEDPMPEASGLPPAELREVHFHRIAARRAAPVAPRFEPTVGGADAPPPRTNPREPESRADAGSGLRLGMVALSAGATFVILFLILWLLKR